MSTPNERAQGLLADLLSIEVDIIIADNLDRGQIPTVTGDDHDAAIREVLDDYVDWLDTHGPVLDEAWAVLTSSVPTAAESRPGGLADQLEWVEERAAAGEIRATELMSAGARADPMWPPMLRRIRGNAAQLRAVAAGEVAEQVDRVRIVRKAWELGTHTIVAQTVVQLDGDVILRADEDSFLTAEREPLRKMHASALRGALENWRMLFDLVAQLVMTGGQVVRALLPPRVGLAVLKQRLGDWRQRDREHRIKARDLFRKGTWKEIRADWNDFRETAVALILDGGMTIESPADGSVSARTVIQPDGDAMWFISEAAADDQTLLDAHASRVTGWYERSGAAVRAVKQIAIAFLRAVVGLATAIWAVVAAASGLAGGWWAFVVGLATGLAVGLAVAILGGAVLLAVRAVLGWRIRKATGLARR
jgi:hypothetical protein